MVSEWRGLHKRMTSRRMEHAVPWPVDQWRLLLVFLLSPSVPSFRLPCGSFRGCTCRSSGVCLRKFLSVWLLARVPALLDSCVTCVADGMLHISGFYRVSHRKAAFVPPTHLHCHFFLVTFHFPQLRIQDARKVTIIMDGSHCIDEEA